MIKRGLARCATLSGVLLAALGVRSDGGPATRPSEALGGADRFLTHVSTDKPIYRPGEKVFVRGVMLRADTRVPIADGQGGQAAVEIKGPKGDIVASGNAQVQEGVMGFAWDVPASQAGGEYTLKVTHPWTGHTPAERKFDIRAYRAPRLKSQIVFVRDGYGPGDTVAASLHVDRAEGGVPAGAKVTVVARVDGNEAYRADAKVDESGNCGANFKLPAQIERGEGTLAMIIEDGGVVETASKTIPILLQTVDLNFYPEGGDLIAGLDNRVYLEARTPAKKPADLAGTILDAAGKEVATFRTAHEGRGRFAFKPEKGGKYTLKVTEPAGIKTAFPLPAVKDAGATLAAAADVVGRSEPVKLMVTSTSDAKLKLTLAQRNVVVASADIGARAGAASEVTVTPPPSADGVLVATLWDEKGTPLAERLIFRKPAKSLNVEVRAEQSDYVPGDRVKLHVKTTDDAGRPVGAVVGLTVTDDSVLEMIEKREQAARLPVMVLLEGDVRELADAHVYMDERNPKAPLATDLLLGTQGWRRFAMVDVAKFLEAHGDAARRALAVRVVTQRDRMRRVDDGARGGEMAEFRLLRAGAEGPPRPMAVPAAAAAEAPVPPAPADDRAKNVQANRKRQEADALVAGDVAEKQAAQRNDMVLVREFAHDLRPNRVEGDRADFAETLYWNAGVKTNDQTGEASVAFALSDAVTTFRVFADAFDKSGALGSGVGAVQSVQPFYFEPKLPLEVTGGDTVQLPLAMVNGMTRDLPLAQITARAVPGLTLAAGPAGFTLKSKDRVRQILTIGVNPDFQGQIQFVLDGQAGPFKDRVARNLSIVPLGFPYESAHGGLLGPDKAATHTITIPRNAVKGSISSSITVFPTPLANMTEALERLIQEPGGCFEQTSSTSYPLVMAQQYFLTHQGVDPKVIDKARGHLDSAYKKLAGFECPKKGYEWFGGDPGHEALTAYGLMQFVDMAQVRDVDKAMIERTRAWLLARRDGKGSFMRDPKAIDSFGGAPQLTTDAYIIWALLESGEKGLEKEVAALKASAMTTNDSYVLALAANAMAITGDAAAARGFMDKLVKKQGDKGQVDGAETSITRSGGEALLVETTALAILAWMREPSYAPQVEKAMQWLAEACKAGRFGSTQSTILALRAIVNYDKSRARPKVAGAVVLLVDGKRVGRPAPFTPDTKGAIKLDDVAELMTPGEHTVELRMEKGSPMPYAVAVKFFNTDPDSSPQCKLGIDVKLGEAVVQEGNVTEANVTVWNKTNDLLPTPIAIVGLPGGMEVRHDQLKELVKSKKIDAYEVNGRQVVCYWRALKPGVKVELPLSLIAAVPGTYTAPASRAYLYYTDEHKQWAPGVKATITAKQ